MKIGSTRTGQFLFEVVPTTGSSDTIMLDPSEAHLLLEFLKNLNCPGVGIRIAGRDPVPATCLLGGTACAELSHSRVVHDWCARPTQKAATVVVANSTEE